MKKIKVGVVGLGHRGRWMFQLACRSFDFVEATAACDILPRNFYETQWLSDMALATEFPDCKFFESYGCHKAHEYLHTSYVARKKY